MKTLGFLLIVMVSGTALCQSGSRFMIARGVIGGGETVSASSRFHLGGTVAQPLAAVPSSARFAIQGGFWVTPAPIIFPPKTMGKSLLLSFQTEPGKMYQVIYSDSPSSPNWQSLLTVAGDGTVKTITNSVSGAGQRFFRIIQQ